MRNLCVQVLIRTIRERNGIEKETLETQQTSMNTRAVVPPTCYHGNPDILSASDIDHSECKYPFALGLEIVSEWGNSVDSVGPVPLFYVSKAAAEARSQSAHETNGPGVVPGWYAVVKPGDSFEVHVKRLFREKFADITDDEDGFRVSVNVDGKESGTWSDHPFDAIGGCGNDIITKGFSVEKRTRDSCSRTHTVQRFQVHKTCTSSELTNQSQSYVSKVGCVELVVATASICGEGKKEKKSYPLWRKGARRSSKSDSKSKNSEVQAENESDPQDSKKCTALSEKVVIKQGKSVQVGRGIVTTHVHIRGTLKMKVVRRLTNADISVHLRERAWLQNRRIIDENCNPITHTVFQNMLASSNVQPSTGEPKIENITLTTDVGMKPGSSRRQVKRESSTREDETQNKRIKTENDGSHMIKSTTERKSDLLDVIDLTED